jgi:hypothetical protein
VLHGYEYLFVEMRIFSGGVVGVKAFAVSEEATTTKTGNSKGMERGWGRQKNSTRKPKKAGWRWSSTRPRGIHRNKLAFFGGSLFFGWGFLLCRRFLFGRRLFLGRSLFLCRCFFLCGQNTHPLSPIDATLEPQ